MRVEKSSEFKFNYKMIFQQLKIYEEQDKYHVRQNTNKNVFIKVFSTTISIQDKLSINSKPNNAKHSHKSYWAHKLIYEFHDNSNDST